MRYWKLNVGYGLMMAAFYVAFCLMTIYSAWYMRAIGLDAGVVGLVIGLAYFAGTVLQQWVTQIADRSRRLSLRALGLIQLFFPVAVLLPILCFPLPNYFVAFLFFLCAMCQISLQSLLNAIAMAYNDRGMEVNFGLGRGLGSLGFAVSSFLLGSYFESAPPISMVYFLAGSLLTTALLLLLLPRIPRPVMVETPDTVKESLESTGSSLLSFLERYPVFYSLVSGMTLLFFTHVVINSYMVYIMESVGGNSGNVGAATALAAGVEMCMMFSYRFVNRRISHRTCLIVSVVAFTVKVAVLYVAWNVGTVYLSQVFQMLAFGLVTPALTYWAFEMVDERDLVQGQTIIMAPATLGGGFGGLFGGFFISLLGIHHTLLLATILSAVGTFICLYGLFHEKKHS